VHRFVGVHVAAIPAQHLCQRRGPAHAAVLQCPHGRYLPAGTVALGGVYSGVYPRESPGGWRLIGRTETALFDPMRDPPALLAAGDLVRFVPA